MIFWPGLKPGQNLIFRSSEGADLNFPSFVQKREKYRV